MPIKIGGIEPFTTIDFPNRLAAVLFCLGCPLRCPYCHNVSLQDFKSPALISWETFLDFLDSRKGLLDGIVFSGGEPLSQASLFESMKVVKDKGFEIALHTSGVNIKRLEEVLPLVDWIGFDVKTRFDLYETRIAHANAQEIEHSLDLLIARGIDFEARTTLDPRVIKKSELLDLAKNLSKKGVRHFALQAYHSFPEENDAPSLYETQSFFKDATLIEEIKSLFETVILR